MNCDDIEQLQHAFIDGELDTANACAFAKHIAACSSCAKQVENLQSFSNTVKDQTTRHALPPGLPDKIIRLSADHQKQNAAGVRKWIPLQWGAGGAALAMAACLAFLLVARPDEQYLIEQQLIASHIRSLQDNHLIDVVSTDQHTVKPWFNGRLDISPPVIDLTTDGYVLTGGRLDYVDRHNAAVIVYRYKAHVINLFVWPSEQSQIDLDRTLTQQGYNMRHWRDGDLQFWAVSDVNPVKLAEFENLYRQLAK